jgi:hypothetical protein
LQWHFAGVVQELDMVAVVVGVLLIVVLREFVVCLVVVLGYKKNARGSKLWQKNLGVFKICIKPIILDFGKKSQRTVPCGQCIECRMKRARDWASRIVLESQLHDENCFITLTYSDDHMPADEKLSVRDAQLFMKRLRKYLGDDKVRFYLAGEYAPETKRPHYHAILFGQFFERAELEDIWQKGRCHSGDVNFKSARYVAQYCMKSDPKDEYSPFALMSRRPGIGSGVIDKISSPYIYMNGHKLPVPRYFREHKDLPLERFSVIEEARMLRQAEFVSDLNQRIVERERDVRATRDHFKNSVDRINQKLLDMDKRMSLTRSKVR